MRILANYGYKSGADSYMVSMELLGDCPKEQVDATVDDLFLRAKSAIQRQVTGKNGNGNGKHTNGNGKPVFRDPTLPCTPRQKSLIIKLANERQTFISGLDEMTMQEASDTIENLLSVEE